MIISNKLRKIIIFYSVIIISLFLTACKKEVSPKTAFESYKEAWEQQNTSEMYKTLSSETKEKVDETYFSDRYKKIYEGIGASNIKITPEYPKNLKEDKDGKLKIGFSVSMDTVIGTVNISGYEGVLVKEKIDKKDKWTIAWSEKMIFPDMEKDDVIKFVSEAPLRGEIFDRNGNPLAMNGHVAIIGIVPNKFSQSKDASINEIAKTLDLKAADIDKKVKSAKNQEQFFPLVTILDTDTEKMRKLTSLPGVMWKKDDARVYPGGEAFGRLVGYVGDISAEELEKNKDKGYSQGNKIGKAGLEQIYEARLRGENGGEIYIASKKDNKETKKSTIVKKSPVQGEAITLTIDAELQNNMYAEMTGDAGAGTAINPVTGEVLALVSSPSYDSNTYSTYETETAKAKRLDAAKNPNTNRFASAYVPGSTFKLITGAIGLKTGVIKPEEVESISGTQWQPDKSWGKNYITRVSDNNSSVNLKDAFISSDNIYFAKQALKIGKDKLISESKAFGFGEAIPLDYPITKSQIANGDRISDDVLLGNTGYGQGQVLMSPLHINMIYSSLLTQGNIMTPILELKNATEPKVWKEKVIAQENINILLEDLTAVVESPNGTGYKPVVPGLKIAGKTGTAETNKTTQGEKAKELGWFVGMNTDKPRLSVIMMIEDVADRGSSHYVVPKVKSVMDKYLKK
jgi:penicillin-binding protein